MSRVRAVWDYKERNLRLDFKNFLGGVSGRERFGIGFWIAVALSRIGVQIISISNPGLCFDQA